MEGFYYRPRVDMEVLREYHEGIIALSACLAGEVQRYIQKGLYEDCLLYTSSAWIVRVLSFKSM